MKQSEPGPKPPRILTLRSAEQPSQLRDELISGLVATDGRVHGQGEWTWKRSIPTQYLYSDAGLAIYSEIISRCKSYYPFAAELEILQTYGDEIAARMFGLPGDYVAQIEQPREEGHQEQHEHQENGACTQPKSKPVREKWGDTAVGPHNYGVNGALDGHAATTATALAIELGSGSLDKTRHLLSSMSKILRSSDASPNKLYRSAPFASIDYEALDLEHDSLVESLSALAERESQAVKTERDSSPRVHIGGLHGLYDDGLAHLHATATSDRAVSIMWLGSSIGNLSRTEAVSFLSQTQLGSGSTMLIGIDNCDDTNMIEQAYNDPEGVTRRFILEGVDQAGRALHGIRADAHGGGLCSDNFEYVNRYNKEVGRHEAYVRCKVDGLTIRLSDEQSITLRKNELVRVEVSYKYTQPEALTLFHASGLRLVQHWTDRQRRHSLYLVERPTIAFQSHHPCLRTLGVERPTNPYGLPSLTEWRTMWKAWDMLTREIMPPDLLLTKPIPLRHIPLFYLGHLPCFTAIHLSRYFNEPLVGPAAFANLFERGIDPDVDEPTKITHWHSSCPNDGEWPSLDEIDAYQQRVRARVERIYSEQGKDGMTRRLARILMMVFEHEAMHYETLVYIALQASSQLRAPAGFQVPDFASLSRGWTRDASGDARPLLLDFSTSSVIIGHDDVEHDDQDRPFDPEHAFGWDVENPRREVSVPAFKLSTPVSNRDYLGYLRKFDVVEESHFPASWSSKSGSATTQEDLLAVKTLYGEVPIMYALEWPVTGSAIQLSGYAKAAGGRLPTREELAVFHTQNPVDAPTNNIGLANLHPLPPTPRQVQRNGRLGGASDGGVWLWTSSIFEAQDGFEPGALYPGYSTDFFDGQHLHISGASFVTPPRLARPSFTNWYQAKYPYVLCGARIAFNA